MEAITPGLWEAASVAFSVWAERHPRPTVRIVTFVGSDEDNEGASSVALSPRDLADEVMRRTPLGEQEVRGLARIASSKGQSLASILEEFASSPAVAPTETQHRLLTSYLQVLATHSGRHPSAGQAASAARDLLDAYETSLVAVQG